jgi:hypothetical protein
VTSPLTWTSTGVHPVYVADADRHGDIDVLGAGYWGDQIAWYETQGDKRFVNRTMSTFPSNRLPIPPCRRALSRQSQLPVVSLFPVYD